MAPLYPAVAGAFHVAGEHLIQEFVKAGIAGIVGVVLKHALGTVRLKQKLDNDFRRRFCGRQGIKRR
jgi:hypothetical protein